MKVAVVCESPLLQKSLESFLKNYIASVKSCDFILSDKKIESEKPLCLVSQSLDSDIRKPFTRAQLILGLERFFKEKPELRIMDAKAYPKALDADLERKIAYIAQKFAQTIVQTIKSHYETGNTPKA